MFIKHMKCIFPCGTLIAFYIAYWSIIICSLWSNKYGEIEQIRIGINIPVIC